MGTFFYTYVGPPAGTQVPREKIRAFLDRLREEKLLLDRASVYAGFKASDLISDDEDEEGAFYWAIVSSPGREIRKVYEGEDHVAAIEAFDAALGRGDNAILNVLAFNGDHPGFRAFLDENGFNNAEVWLVALSAPLKLRIMDLAGGDPDTFLELQYIFGSDGKSGPSTLMGSPLESLLKECFGSTLLEAFGTG